MSLKIGIQLGTYKIVGPLGAGGMGEVYRATDTTLDREVALKLLPDMMARDPELVARFEREAKLLASLNHPQIAAIYGFEQAEGKRFLVLEIVEGPTLAERIAAGPLMVEESLDIARQMAEALEAAHDKGIIHRDLKPANVKITPEGQVKVLDFGLAKALAKEDSDTEMNPGASPTITQDFTRPGMILGTAAYMSPEQARGRPVDKRSDIWSFGCVLYECLTGESMFLGETVTDSIGAILHKQPDWERLPAHTPPTVQLLLRRCLAKDRKQRLRDIGDVRIELEAAIADPTSSSLGLARAALAGSTETRLRSTRGVMTVVGGMLLAVIVMLGIDWTLWLEPPSTAVVRYSIALPQRESHVMMSRFPTIGISADGELLSYTSGTDFMNQNVFLRRRDVLLPTTLVKGAGRARFPTFSPDGKWLAYYDSASDELLKVPVQGGPPIKLCESEDVVGLTWTTNGYIIFADREKSGRLMRVGENGGTPEEIVLAESKGKWPRWVFAMPDGQAVLYSLSETQFRLGKSSIEVYSFETGQSKRLVENGAYPLYAKSGHLLFVLKSDLMVATLDSETLDRTSEPVRAVAGIRSERLGAAGVAITDRGTLYYHAGDEQANTPRSIYLLKLEGDGNLEVFSAKTGLFSNFSIGPNGRFVAIDVSAEEDETQSIWLLDARRDVLALLSTEPGRQSFPVFSPDGSWVYYLAADEAGEWLGIFRRKRDGSGGAELVYDGPRECDVSSISPDGKDLFVTESSSEELSPGTSYDIAVLHLGVDGEKATREPLYQGPSFQFSPAVSPNGRWMAFASGHEGEGPGVYVKSIADAGGVYSVSGDGGSASHWSPDGKTLYFQNFSDSKRRLMAAEVLSGADAGSDDKQATFEIGEIKPVFDLRTDIRAGQIMPDGKSFLVIANAQKEGVEEGVEEVVDDLAVIHVVRNFFTELERLAPAKK